MSTGATGRNNPCPYGSGKKLKKCCLLKQEGVQFGSLNEVRASVGRHTQQRNQRPLDEFRGLSPEQMHRLLHFTFTSEEVYRENTRFGGINREEDFLDLHIVAAPLFTQNSRSFF